MAELSPKTVTFINRQGQKEKTMLGSDNVIRNYEDGFVGGSHTFAAWFTESRAHQIAKSMGKELETV